MNVHANDCPRRALSSAECLCEHQQELEREEAEDIAAIQRLTKENGDKYRAAAKRIWASAGTDIDDDAKVSRPDGPGAEPGAYVQAWVWVDDDDAGIE